MLGLACLGCVSWLLARCRRLAPALRPAGCPQPGPARQAGSGPAGRVRSLAAWPMAGLLTLLLLSGLVMAWVVALDQARAQARWLAETLGPAVVFGQARDAQMALQALRHLPQVRAAWVHGPDGQRLAQHVQDGPAPGQPLASATLPQACRVPTAGLALLVLRPDHVLLGHAVHYLGVPVGELCLSVSLHWLYRPALMWTALAAALLALAGGWQRKG